MEQNEFIEKYEDDLKTNEEQFEKLITILEKQTDKINLLEESVKILQEEAEEQPAEEQPAEQSESLDDDIKRKEEELAILKKKKEEADNDEEGEESDEESDEDKPPEEPEKPKVEKASFVGYEMGTVKSENVSFRDSLREYFKK